jgi:hypothetical protein
VVTAAIAAAGVVVSLTMAGCGIGSPTASPGADSSVSTGAATGVAAPSGQRIVLRFDQEVVAATLADTTAGREFAELLPLTLDLSDPMGQAKSGRLPTPIDAAGATTVLDPDRAGIYYVPDRAMIAIYYDDLGQTVPPPGIVPLGSLDADVNAGTDADPEAGLAAIADAGNRMRVLIDLADANNS